MRGDTHLVRRDIFEFILNTSYMIHIYALKKINFCHPSKKKIVEPK